MLAMAMVETCQGFCRLLGDPVCIGGTVTRRTVTRRTPTTTPASSSSNLGGPFIAVIVVAAFGCVATLILLWRHCKTKQARTRSWTPNSANHHIYFNSTTTTTSNARTNSNSRDHRITNSYHPNGRITRFPSGTIDRNGRSVILERFDPNNCSSLSTDRNRQTRSSYYNVTNNQEAFAVTQFPIGSVSNDRSSTSLNPIDFSSQIPSALSFPCAVADETSLAPPSYSSAAQEVSIRDNTVNNHVTMTANDDIPPPYEEVSDASR